MKNVNFKSFKETMGKFVTGITVVSINKKNQYIGKTVNSFSSLSLKPPLILFSLDKKSSSLKHYKSSEFIGINILNADQKNISSHFASKDSNWIDINYFLTKNKIPMIKKSLANISSKKIKYFSQGDHYIFVCEVIEVSINHLAKPLIYFNSKYY